MIDDSKNEGVTASNRVPMASTLPHQLRILGTGLEQTVNSVRVYH